MNTTPASTAAGARDPRIDFFRGLSLYMVFLDHVVGDPFAQFTYHAIGFSDAAEIFVFLSGLACGIAYTKVLLRGGWRDLLKAIRNRALRIYLFYAATSAITVTLAALAHNVWASSTLQYTLGYAAVHPIEALLMMLGLVWSPSDAGIFLLYIVLTLAIVPLALWSLRRHAHLALFVSGIVWLFSGQLLQAAAPVFSEWYLNPFAWQFLFLIGIYFGIGMVDPSLRLLTVARLRPLMPLAAAAVVAAFAYKLAIFAGPILGMQTGSFRFSDQALAVMKTNLSALRLGHFLAVALVVATVVRPEWRFLKSLPSRILIWSGMRSLEIYSISVVFGVVDSMAVLAYHPIIFDRLILDVTAMAMMGAVSIMLGYYRNRPHLGSRTT